MKICRGHFNVATHEHVARRSETIVYWRCLLHLCCSRRPAAWPARCWRNMPSVAIDISARARYQLQAWRALSAYLGGLWNAHLDVSQRKAVKRRLNHLHINSLKLCGKVSWRNLAERSGREVRPGVDESSAVIVSRSIGNNTPLKRRE